MSLISSLKSAVIQAQDTARDSTDGLEKQRLRALADSMMAEVRVQQQKARGPMMHPALGAPYLGA